MRYMLYVGSAHDEQRRQRVANEVRIRGLQVATENGPFGTVVVECEPDNRDSLVEIPEVTDVVDDPEACPYGQTDCASTEGGACLCGFPSMD